MTQIDIVERAREVLDIEAQGIDRVKARLGDSFKKAAELILQSRGRVVVTGIGKSGLIGRKIAATFSSTGTPSVFLHPVEALHGDLGVVIKGDVVLAISNSGNTQELLRLVPVLKERGVPIIAFTGNLDSRLAHMSDCVIDTGVEKEACGLGLAPTASTTATLAVGDALAVVLLELKDFSEKDFRRNHPSGSLGERLKIQVREVMITGSKIPVVTTGTLVRDAIREMDSKGLGAVLVVDESGGLKGIFTDGDVRRTFIRWGLDGLAREGLEAQSIGEMRIDEIMTQQPKFISPDVLAADALAIMEEHLITVLPVIEVDGRLCGIVHLHDLLGKGEFKFLV